MVYGYWKKGGGDDSIFSNIIQVTMFLNQIQITFVINQKEICGIEKSLQQTKLHTHCEFTMNLLEFLFYFVLCCIPTIISCLQ